MTSRSALGRHFLKFSDYSVTVDQLIGQRAEIGARLDGAGTTTAAPTPSTLFCHLHVTIDDVAQSTTLTIIAIA